MSQSPRGSQPPLGDLLRLSGIDWQTYSRLLRAFAERPAIRLTYDRGQLEIRAPLDRLSPAPFVGTLVHVLTEEFGLPLRGGGRTTLRRRSRRRGIEPDHSFWIANAARMAGRRRLNLRTDPPPDLSIEVDVTHSSLDRLGIYAALGVPEVWRLEGDGLIFYLLGPDGQYSSGQASRSFPLVTPADLMRFLQLARQAGDDNAVIRQFRDWVRQCHAAGGAPATP